MSKLNRLAGALVVLLLIGSVGGSMGLLVAERQVTACTHSADACQ